MNIQNLGNGFFCKTYTENGICYEVYLFKDNDKMIYHHDTLPAFRAYVNDRLISESYYYLGELQSSKDFDSNGKEF